MRARRTDANLADIVACARKAGFLVYIRNDALADLDVQLHGRHEVWEVKDGAKALSRQRLTPLQQEIRGQGWTIHTITGADDVLAARTRLREAAMTVFRCGHPKTPQNTTRNGLDRYGRALVRCSICNVRRVVAAKQGRNYQAPKPCLLAESWR